MSKSIFKNSIYKVILSVFNLFVPLLVVPYISDLFDVELYNVFNTASSVLSFFLVFAVFGVYNYGIRGISRVRDRQDELSALFTNLFFFSAITSLLVSAGYLIYVAVFITEKFKSVYYVLVIQILANVFATEWVNEAVENYGFITLKTIVVRSLYLASIFIFVKKPDDVALYGVIMSISVLLNNLLSFIYLKRKIKFSFKSFALAKYIKPLFIMLLISNVNILYTQLDKLFLGYFVPFPANTEYTAPANVINMIGVMLVSLIMVSVPRLSYYIANGREEDYLALLTKSTRAFFLVLAPCCIGLCVLSPEVMYLYTDNAYTYAYPVLSLCALRFLLSSLTTIFTNQIMYLRGKEKVMVKILAIGGGLNLIFNSICVYFKALSPITAVITTAVAEGIMLAVMYWYIRVKMGVGFRVFTFPNMKYLLFSLSFFPIVRFIKSFHLGVILNCALAIGSCGLVYLLLLIITKDDMLKFFLGKFVRRKNRG